MSRHVLAAPVSADIGARRVVAYRSVQDGSIMGATMLYDPDHRQICSARDALYERFPQAQLQEYVGQDGGDALAFALGAVEEPVTDMVAWAVGLYVTGAALFFAVLLWWLW